MTWVLILVMSPWSGVTIRHRVGPFATEVECRTTFEQIKVDFKTGYIVGSCVSIKGSVSPNKEFD